VATAFAEGQGIDVLSVTAVQLVVEAAPAA
jgi:hypothetical protein